MCDKIDCSNKPSVFPVLLVYAHKRHGRRPPIEITLGLNICEPCSKQTVIDDLVGDEGWDQIVSTIVSQGQRAPVRERTAFEFRPLDERVDFDKIKSIKPH